MKKVFFTIVIFALFTSFVKGQYKVSPNRPFSVLNSSPGFVTINEITGGVGLGGHSTPNSKSFFGFTSVNGYQVNRNFIAGAGVGLSFYDGGLLVPLFLDFRFAFSGGILAPYIYGDGGLLLDPSDFNSTKLFINPGAGVRYTMGRRFAVNIGAGILSQVDGTNRASFVTLKLGGVYVF